MNQTYAVFFDICLWRRGPRDLPASKRLEIITLLAYLVTGMLLPLQFEAARYALPRTLIEAAMSAGFLYLLLALRGYPSRFTQSFTALLGCGTFFNLAALPFVHVFANPEQLKSLLAPAFLFWLLLIGWSTAVFGHVLRQAMNIHIGWGVALAVLYTALAMLVLQLLFSGGA